MESAAHYAGCKCIVSSTGLCGVTLGIEGRHAGVVYDFFVSPYEDIRAVYALMELALDEGANQLTIWENSLLTTFFEQFGFEAVCVMDRRGAPPNWIPEVCKSALHPVACPDFVFMARKIYETSPAVKAWMARTREAPHASGSVDGRRGPCANCAAPVASDNHYDLFGGYECTRCGFIYVCGTLTTGIPQFEQAMP